MIRARAKRPEDIDPRFVCCDYFKAKAREMAGRTLELDPEILYMDVRCRGCGSMNFYVPYRVIHGMSGDYSAVPLPFVDLDEG